MKHMFNQDKVQRFSLRKYSIGLASVLLGIFLVGAPSVVYGDESTASDLELVVSDVGESDSRQEIETSEVVNVTSIDDANFVGTAEVSEGIQEDEIQIENKNQSALSNTEDYLPHDEKKDNLVNESVVETETQQDSEKQNTTKDIEDIGDLSIEKNSDAHSDQAPKVEVNSTFRRNSARTLIGDNYRWKHTAYDAWGYPSGQCTSFVAFRLAETNGFSNVAYLGNAGDWGYTAKSRGAYVDNTPAVGSVAWFAPSAFGADSNYGHVAWVAAIDRNYVIIEEYNINWSKSYNSRRILASLVTGYIHFKDLQSPNSNTTSPIVDSTPGTLAPSGSYYFTKRAAVKNEPKISAVDMAYYESGMSVNYDKVLEADGYRWLSYLSFQGNRRYIPIEQLKVVSSNINVPTPDSNTSGSVLASSGTYVFVKRSPIKNEAKINAVDIAYYDVGSSVNYDKVLEADGYRWLSYLSFQGNRRFIPIERLNASNSSVTPIVEKPRFDLPPSGTYTFSKLSFIKNEPKVSAATIATYGVGMSVNYDRLVDSDGKTWLSYISNSGVRRYIAIT